MSQSLRYQNPVVIEHLAGQFVAGAMTSLVRHRVESLRQEIPALDEAIAHFSDAFSELNQVIEPAKLHSEQKINAWQVIQRGIRQNVVEPEKAKTSFWSNVLVWRGLSVASFAAMLFVVSLVGLQTSQTTTSPAYFASMTPVNTQQQQPVYVISVYKGSEEARPELVLQWVKNNKDKSLNEMVKTTELHIWSEDKETKQLAYIGKQPKANDPIQLGKKEWKAISNSQRLFVTTSSEVPTEQSTLFTGLCLQLKSWKTA